MIRDLVVLRSVEAHYKNNAPNDANGPGLSMFMDGSLKKSISDAPAHSTYKTRIFTAPDGAMGYIPHITSDAQFNVDLKINADPVSAFSEQILWHYYEITFRGTVHISLYLDGTLIRGDGDGEQDDKQRVVLTTSKEIDTAKAYLTPLAYGRMPHVVNDSDDSGDIDKWRPIALTARFHTSVKAATEGQITYRGDCNVIFYFDGKQIGDPYLFKGERNEYGNEIYTTKRFYLSEDTLGQVFQYIQVDGSGDIIAVETDAHQLDLEPLTVPSTDPG